MADCMALVEESLHTAAYSLHSLLSGFKVALGGFARGVRWWMLDVGCLASNFDSAQAPLQT